MKITLNTLKEYEAPVQVLEFIERNGLDGAPATKIMESGADYEVLHFIRNNFSLNDKELESYFKACKIENSKKIYNSTEVTSGLIVSGSSEVIDSSYIYNSKTINNSKYIYNSSSIFNSNDINFGEEIFDSSRIFNSFNVNNTSGALDANYIDWSENISYSSHIEESKYIYKCKSLNDSYFCGFCTDSSHLLFCTGIENKSYMIFNQKVSLQTFEEAKEKLLFMLSAENPQFLRIDQTKYFEDRFVVNHRFDAVFDGLSANFYGQVGNFENYSDEVFISLFFK